MVKLDSNNVRRNMNEFSIESQIFNWKSSIRS
jgi:hypothetical protein